MRSPGVEWLGLLDLEVLLDFFDFCWPLMLEVEKHLLLEVISKVARNEQTISR